MLRKYYRIAVISLVVIGSFVFTTHGTNEYSKGEENVLRVMPEAEAEFGKADPEAYALFRHKVTHFETKEGFQNEAEMEAARRVLGVAEGEVVCMLNDNCDD